MKHGLWNIWHGCHKCSRGCDNCYMYALDERYQVPEKSSVVTLCKGKPLPLQRNRAREFKVVSGARIRVNMTSDSFLEEADEWRDEHMWDVIRQRPDVRFWVLTKRPHRIAECLPSDWGDGWGNVTLAISCEDQDAFDMRWPYLAEIPSKLKGICAAPLIGPLDITSALPYLSVVECGGENYDGCRPCRDEWVKSLSEQTRAADVPFTFFETGTYFIRNGRMYHTTTKGLQSQYAYMSGYSHGGKDEPWELYLPDGTPLDVAEYQSARVFNAKQCMFCSSRIRCPGCSNCGKCGDVELVNEANLLLMEQQILLS